MGAIGLYFYQARWYDPVIGRFSQPDNVIPNLYSNQAWDRYSYVNSNPLNATDPTGHFACDDEDTLYWCQKGRTPVTIKVSSEFPLTQAEAERYMTLANTRGAWNDYHLGNFPVEKYYQLLLSMEFSPLSGAANQGLPELVVRDFYARCTGYCNPYNDFDLLRYIAIKRLNTPGSGRNAAPGTLFEDDPHNPTDFYFALTHPKEEWKTGCDDGNVVCNWGNSSMIDYYIKTGETDADAWVRYDAMVGRYKPFSTAYNTFYLIYDNWFALTANQSRCLYQKNYC
jgi:RHS repeat-associated protein